MAVDNQISAVTSVLTCCQYGHIRDRFTELIVPMKLPQKLNYNGLSMILLWQRKPPSSLQSDPVRKHKFLKNLLTEKGTKLPASGQLELSRCRSKMYEPLRSKT